MVDGVTTNLLLQHTLPYKKEDPMTIQTKKKTTWSKLEGMLMHRPNDASLPYVLACVSHV